MLLLNASDVDPNYPFFYLILRDRTEKAELRGLMGGAKLVPAHQGTMGKNGGSQKVRSTKKCELDWLQRGLCPINEMYVPIQRTRYNFVSLRLGKTVSLPTDENPCELDDDKAEQYDRCGWKNSTNAKRP